MWKSIGRIEYYYLIIIIERIADIDFVYSAFFKCPKVPRLVPVSTFGRPML